MLLFGKRAGAAIKEVPNKPNGHFDFEKLYNNIDNKTRVVSICNPNNPSSLECDRTELLTFCERVGQHFEAKICIDEAYIEFSQRGEKSSLVDQIASNPNICIVRTFSKAHGLAGIRLGYAIAHKAIIHKLYRLYPALGMAPGVTQIAAGIASLDSNPYLEKIIDHNNKTKSIVCEAFDGWGVNYFKSSTNFILAESERFENDVVRRLRNHDILITKWPSMYKHIRISMGSLASVKYFVDTIKNYII